MAQNTNLSRRSTILFFYLWTNIKFCSRLYKRRHFKNTNLLAGNNHVINIFTSEDMGNIHCVLYNKYRILHGCEKIWILCSSGKNNISRVSAANE